MLSVFKKQIPSQDSVTKSWLMKSSGSTRPHEKEPAGALCPASASGRARDKQTTKRSWTHLDCSAKEPEGKHQESQLPRMEEKTRGGEEIKFTLYACNIQKVGDLNFSKEDLLHIAESFLQVISPLTSVHIYCSRLWNLPFKTEENVKQTSIRRYMNWALC